MAMIETRLLARVAYGTQGGPTWSTIRTGLRSGHTRRKARRSRPLYRFLVLYQNLSEEHHQDVLNAFNACRGGLHSFRLKDWSDYVATDELVAIAAGGEESVQLQKAYTFGTETAIREIRKPVAGTVLLTADEAPLAATVDTTTGIVTFTATEGQVIRWSGEFDVPVMFEQDELLFSADNRGADAGLFLTADVGLEEDIGV